MNASTEDLLQVDDLEAGFELPTGYAPAVQDVGFRLAPGETLAVVGESGCGKSVLAYALLGLRKASTARISRGTVRLAGTDLLSLSAEELRLRRARDIAIIFQEPATCLNPVMTVYAQIAETLRAHAGERKSDLRPECVALLREVGIPDPERRLDQYPHQLSGGMRQRVMIAIALSCRPRVLVADEPTTALDVTIQAQVLDLIDALKRSHGMGVILVTHNLGIVAGWAQRVMVMYAGRIVETGSIDEILCTPRHPYTRALLRSLPQARPERFGERLEEIPGTVPALDAMPRGCRFAARCPEAEDACREQAQALLPLGTDRAVACWKAGPR